MFCPGRLPGTSSTHQTPKLLHQFFEAQASARPDQIAVISPSRCMTYALVEKAANRLAHHLRGNGIGPGALVGLLLPRSAEVYVGLLGILKAGAAYVPLDPDYPPERISYILSDCKASFLVTSELAHLADFPAATNTGANAGGPSPSSGERCCSTSRKTNRRPFPQSDCHLTKPE